MVYGCGNKCVKFLVFFFNFLVFVVGVAILGVALGIRFNNDIQTYFQNLLNNAKSPVDLGYLYVPLYVLMGVGALLILTGFLGCCGAWTENTCLLAVFFAIVLILFIAELGCGIAILVNKEDFKNKLSEAITERVKDFDNLSKEDQDSIYGMEKALQCCGCTGAGDYVGVTKHTTACPKNEGCCNKIWDKAEGQLKIVGGVAIGILVIELLAMIFSCILCQAFKRGDYQYA